MRWILDDGPFGHLAKVCHHDSNLAWDPGHLWIAGTTAAAATPTSQLLLQPRAADPPFVSTFEVFLGSDDPAADVLIELHGDPLRTTDLAEHESIAWALTHGTDAVFVCADLRAALTALAELGHGRVAHPFDVWIYLRQRNWIGAEAFRRLCDLTKKHDQGLPRMPSRVRDQL